MTAWENKRNQNHRFNRINRKRRRKKIPLSGQIQLQGCSLPSCSCPDVLPPECDPWTRANIGLGLWGLWGGNNTFARCTRMHCRVAFWGPAKLSGLSRTCKFDFSKDTFQLSAGSDPFWSGLILDWSWSLFSPALQPSKQREVWYEKHLPRNHRLRKLPQEELEGAGEGVHVLDGGQDLEVALRSDFWERETGY